MKNNLLLIAFIFLLTANNVFTQNAITHQDSLKEKNEKIPLLFLKTSLKFQTEQFEAAHFDLSGLNYSGVLTEKYSTGGQSLHERLYLSYLFQNSKNNLGFWGDILKYANLTGAAFLAATHISKYGFLKTKPEKK